MHPATEAALRAAAVYSKEGIQPRDDSSREEPWFGRLENLPMEAEFLIKPMVAGAINKEDQDIWTEVSNLLDYAQLHGQLPDRNPVLPDYYSSVEMEEKLGALLEALLSFVSRPNQKRPFNILLTAAPGSGKSFFAQCLARKLSSASAQAGRGGSQHPLIEVNLSLAEEFEQVNPALHEAYSEIRDQRALGRTPLVLLDEFDTFLPSDSKAPRPDSMDKLFARMLAPLWDGIFVIDGRYRRLGGFILIVAASNEMFIQRLSEANGKARDFASRIDVTLRLPPLEGLNEADRFEAKIRMSIAAIKKYMGSYVNRIELAVLDAIGGAEFPGRNRAIDQIAMLSSVPADGTFRLENLPKRELLQPLAQNFNTKVSQSRYGQSWILI